MHSFNALSGPHHVRMSVLVEASMSWHAIYDIFEIRHMSLSKTAEMVVEPMDKGVQLISGSLYDEIEQLSRLTSLCGVLATG